MVVFVIIAVEQMIISLNLKIQDKSLTEDDMSDCINDLSYYKIILEELKKQSSAKN